MIRFTKDELKVMISNALEILAEQEGEVTAKSTKGEKVSALLNKVPGISNDLGKGLANILSEIIGEKVVYTHNNNYVPAEGSILVDIHTGSNLINKTFLFLGTKNSGNHGIFENGTKKPLSCSIGGQGYQNLYWRYAKKEEIKAFFDTLVPPRRDGEPTVHSILKDI